MSPEALPSGKEPSPSQALRRFHLHGEVDGVEQTFPLRPGTHRVGSLAEGNQIVLPARGVSRCHAEIVVDAGTVTVRDLWSKNGTFVDGVRVSEALTQPGSVIRIGVVSLRLTANPPAAA
ncbi:MAG TPA: FHA domain-containing protein [Thermoanaerobaculia bacterium]|nr:FHA domain-containing protein [Thermoanaerobaculia bacterium]